MRLITIVLCGTLCAGVRYSQGSDSVADDLSSARTKQLAARLEDLKQDISTINLINGLRLTRQQSETILELARLASRARGDFSPNGRNLAKAQTEFTESDPQPPRTLLEKAVAAYEAFKAEDLKGEPPRGAVSRNAVTMEHQVKDNEQLEQLLKQHQGPRGAHPGKDPKAQQRLAELDGVLNRTLADGQKEIVKTFKACLVPPADLRDPVRAGQAAAAGAVKKLEEFRALSQEDWNARKDALAAKEADPHGKLNASELAAEKSRILVLVEKARKLSDMDFEMQKDTFAEQLKPVKQHISAPGELSWAAHWLLASRAVPLLETRLKNTAQPAASSPETGTKS